MPDAAVLFITNDDLRYEETAPGVRRKVMTYNDQLMMVKVGFEKGGVGAVHEHVHLQMSYVESGVFEVEIGGEKRILNAGDAFSVPSHVLHGVICLEAGVLIDVFNPCREDFL